MSGDAPDVTGRNDLDSATIKVSRPEEVQGAAGPGGTATEFCISLDGPVMRFLLNGHVWQRRRLACCQGLSCLA